jgi:hypothetical protein
MNDTLCINDVLTNSQGTISTQTFLETLKTWFHKNVPRDPGQWTFGDLKRQDDGSFADDVLVDLLTTATDTISGPYFFFRIATCT